MDETMVERVAKAIHGAYWAHEWDRMDPKGVERALTLQQARAAIEAMRDPSFEMMQAMYEAMFDDKWDGTQAPMVGAGFDAAIDAALATPPAEG